MAYAGTATIASKGSDGQRGHWAVTIAETEAAAGSEWSVGGLPQRVTIFSYKATITAGTGATVNPILGNAAARLAGDTARQATSVEVKALRAEARDLKEALAEQMLENRLLKKSMIGDGGDQE